MLLDRPRLLLAVLVGGIVGALTEWSVLHLPFALLPLSNSAAPWVIVAFAVALTGRRTWESVVLAVVTLVALVLGFYVAEALRGWGVPRHQIVFWTVSSVIIGPLVGLAAAGLRHGGRDVAAVGAGLLGGILIGEAAHGLHDLQYSTKPGYWYAQLVVGAVLAGGLALSHQRSRRQALDALRALALAVCACGVAAVATFVAYQIS